jgi:sulfate/thiosulfate transport system ATP-binding protein
MGIEVRNIQKRFGSFVALDNINLNFETGKLVALLGPSGCGKTTLLRIIAGLEQADHGQVILDGEDASLASVRERQVGFVFQHYALFKHMTVFDNVAFGMRMKPRSQRPDKQQIKDKVFELLNLVQLDWLADRFPSQLSGGQRQRIALARALAVEPRVLLLDEPFGALDAKVRKELRRWLRKLHDELHISSIFVTHDQEEALEVADEVVLMDHGHVEQVGTPEHVYHTPSTPFVYGFLGSVNTFKGTLSSGGIVLGSDSAGRDVLTGIESGLPDGSPVIAFARPHELAISTDTGSAGVSARVSRVLALGTVARVELDGQANSLGQHFEVSLGEEDVARLALQTGQQVKLLPKRLKVFDARQPSSLPPEGLSDGGLPA